MAAQYSEQLKEHEKKKRTGSLPKALVKKTVCMSPERLIIKQLLVLIYHLRINELDFDIHNVTTSEYIYTFVTPCICTNINMLIFILSFFKASFIQSFQHPEPSWNKTFKLPKCRI